MEYGAQIKMEKKLPIIKLNAEHFIIILKKLKVMFLILIIKITKIKQFL